MKSTPYKLIIMLGILISPALIQITPASPVHTGLHATQLSDTVALSAFMDGLIHSYMSEHKAAAATAAIVRDGQVLFRHAYGYANISEGIPASPDTTLFRIASISKLFTWLAVLQQVETGRLDLDADVNHYLTSFSIPDAFDEPVTLRSLMSHTPGFEDILLRLFTRKGDPVPSLEEIFSEQMPERVAPPMQVASYSNHGTGLAQYLVEKVSGMTFEKYAEEHIFQPLGMHFSTFRQPVPDHLRRHLANGYAWRNGQFKMRDFEVVPLGGAGGASASASDMATFMKALLNDTQHGNITLMDSATYAIMKEPVLVHASHMNPALHGFLDISPAHIRIIGHGGNTFLFHSMLALFPAHDAGLFISFSGEGAAMAPTKVLEHFVRRYFADPGPPPVIIQLDDDYLQGFTGRYLPNRRPHSDILKVFGLINTVQIRMQDNQLLYTDFTGSQHTLQPVDSTTFYIEKNSTFVGFDRQPGEKAQKLYLSNYPVVAAERATWSTTIQYHLVLLALTLACIFYILVVWPWLYYARKLYDKKPKNRKPLPIFAKTIAGIASLFLLIFYSIMLIAASGPEIIFGIPTGIHIALFFPLAAVPFVFIMILGSIYVWIVPQTKYLSRVFYTLATIVFIMAVWQLHFFNMLGWKF